MIGGWTGRCGALLILLDWHPGPSSETSSAHHLRKNGQLHIFEPKTADPYHGIGVQAMIWKKHQPIRPYHLERRTPCGPLWLLNPTAEGSVASGWCAENTKPLDTVRQREKGGQWVWSDGRSTEGVQAGPRYPDMSRTSRISNDMMTAAYHEVAGINRNHHKSSRTQM